MNILVHIPATGRDERINVADDANRDVACTWEESIAVLSRRKKTRSWLKTKHDGLSLLTGITQTFAQSAALDTAFQQLGEQFAAHTHAAATGIYLYDPAAEVFELHFSAAWQEMFSEAATLTPAMLRQCQLDPTAVGMVTVFDLPAEAVDQCGFFQPRGKDDIHTIGHLPLTAHGNTYGLVLLASKDLHHLTEEESAFFTVLARYMSLATEKGLLAEQFEQEVALKVSQLRESEEKYRVLFEDASDAIVIIEIETQRLLEVNRQAELLVGYTREELLTRTVNDFGVRKGRKQLSAGLLQAVTKRKSVKLQERQIRRKDGEWVWVEIHASLVEYHGQHVILAIVRDITQRKQIELEKEVIDSVNQALISSLDVRDVYRTVGHSLFQVFTFDWMDILLPGSTADNVRVFVSINVHKNLSILEEREYPQAGPTIATIFHDGQPQIVHYQDEHTTRSIPDLLGKDLETSLFFPLEYQGIVIGMLHFGSYQPNALSARHYDFLQRIASQLAIAIENTLLFHKVNEERAVYKHLIENVNEIVFQANPRGKIIFVNHRVYDILGYTPEETIGTNFFSYVFPDDMEEAKAAFRLALRHKQPLSGDYRAFHKNGALLTISIYTRPIFEENRVVGMQAIVQDITPPPTRFTSHRNGLHELIGRSSRMQDIYQLIMSVAETDSTILIHGESGTGKELIAQAIHASSHRKNKPFIVVNCAAYSEHLLESELFGHERGAFTGAHRRKLGRFELAKGGTIFLDEIGEIPLHSQLLLLRVLQNKTFERVGGEKTLEADVRIVAATNKNLTEEMQAGRFREDLYYRLNVIPIEVPPLRDRKEDIPYLVEHFLKKYSEATGKNVLKCSQGAMDLLTRYEWYGNVRELENAIERAVVMATGSVISPGHLPATLQQPDDTLTPPPVEVTEPSSLYAQEKQLILNTLRATNWNKYQTAKRLGITRSTLYSKIGKYQLSEPDK